MGSIPVVDVADHDFADGLLEACREVGFVAVTGHGIPISSFDAMRGLLRRLFDIDDEAKAAGAITRDNYRGFIPLGFFTPNRVEANGADADLYEGYKLHWECESDRPVAKECPLYGPNRWAAHVPDMAELVLDYWRRCDRFADVLLDIFAAELGVDPTAFRAWHDEPLTNMTLLHYPAQPPTQEQMGIHPHKDTNVITFLHPDPVGGLEVRAVDGSWIDVDAPTDALIVNTGEMLELWSGGRFPATPHRVINRSGRERYSFPYFVVPRHDVVVEPLLPCLDGYRSSTMPVGPLSAEVWRTNWSDESPSDAGFDLGALDRLT